MAMAIVDRAVVVVVVVLVRVCGGKLFSGSVISNLIRIVLLF